MERTVNLRTVGRTISVKVKSTFSDFAPLCNSSGIPIYNSYIKVNIMEQECQLHFEQFQLLSFMARTCVYVKISSC